MRYTGASVGTLTIPLITFNVGDEIHVLRYGAGEVTIARATGVSLYSEGSATEMLEKTHQRADASCYDEVHSGERMGIVRRTEDVGGETMPIAGIVASQITSNQLVTQPLLLFFFHKQHLLDRTDYKQE